MKIFTTITGFLIIIITVISVVSLCFSLNDAFDLRFSFNKNGIILFIEQFEKFYGLYAGNIVLISVYYWMRQLKQIEQSNKKITIDKTITEARYFYSQFQPIAGKFILDMREIDDSLFDINWNYSDFYRESVKVQNDSWLLSYSKASEKVKDYMKVNQVFHELDALSGAALFGDIDDELLFKLIGKGYCAQVEILYPFISTYREKTGKMMYFDNVPVLYKKWKQKLLKHTK